MCDDQSGAGAVRRVPQVLGSEGPTPTRGGCGLGRAWSQRECVEEKFGQDDERNCLAPSQRFSVIVLDVSKTFPAECHPHVHYKLFLCPCSILDNDHI